jgi:signal transduction histidine kinase
MPLTRSIKLHSFLMFLSICVFTILMANVAISLKQTSIKNKIHDSNNIIEVITSNWLQLKNTLNTDNSVSTTELIRLSSELSNAVNRLSGSTNPDIFTPLKQLQNSITVEPKSIQLVDSHIERLVAQKISLNQLYMAQMQNYNLLQLSINSLGLFSLWILVGLLLYRHSNKQPSHSWINKLFPFEIKEFTTSVHTTDQTNSSMEEIKRLHSELKIIHKKNGRLLNHIVEQDHLLEQNKQQLINLEKYSALGVLTGGVAHELNNPLMGLQNYIEYLMQLDQSPKAIKILGRSHNEILRMQKLVQNMLIFGRENQDKTIQKVNLVEVLDSVLGFMKNKLIKNNIEVTFEHHEEVYVLAEADTLKQVIINLVSNASDAAKASPHPFLKIKVEKMQDNKVLCLLKNNGSHIPEHIQNKIFDPFFTTKPVGKGTGLGLSISRQLMQKMDGTITLESSTIDETIFSLCLKSADSQEIHLV